MKKEQILILIPLITIAGILIYTWTVIFFNDDIAAWQHYAGIILFSVLVFFFFKDYQKSIIATGISLILGVCNLFTLTPSVSWVSYAIRIGSLKISTPSFQPLSLGLLVLYTILNFDNLVNIHLDYKEAQELKKNTQNNKL